MDGLRGWGWVAILSKSQGSAALAERSGAGAEFERYADFGGCLRFVCTMLQRREMPAKVGEY